MKPGIRRQWATGLVVALLAALTAVVVATSLHRVHRRLLTDPIAPASAAVIMPPGQPAPQALAGRIAALGRGFDGRAGIAVLSIDDGWAASYDGARAFPQQSVSKLWVAAATLDLVDQGKAALSDPVTVTARDLTLFHQPIREEIGPDGLTTNIGDLMRRALTQSDNAANDVLFRRAGGQAGVRAFLADRGIAGIAIGPGEKLLQTRAAGMAWQDRYAIGRTFYTERDQVPLALRAKALDDYVAMPPDGASPQALVRALARLKRGELLSQGSTQVMLDLMSHSSTGRGRLRGGLAPGWTMAHKTGTGQVLGDFATGYNDSGILTSPSGRSYALAVLIASTRRPVPERQALMQEVTRAVIACEAAGEDGC